MENSNSTFAELAAWFVGGPDPGSPEILSTELLDRAKLDFSVESLRVVDSWLSELHQHAPEELTQGRWLPSVLRCGAYVGEVIARHASATLNWVEFDELIKHDPKHRQHFGDRRRLETCAFLVGPSVVTSPINKVCKFLWDGPEENVWYYAGMILDMSGKPDGTR